MADDKDDCQFTNRYLRVGLVAKDGDLVAIDDDAMREFSRNIDRAIEFGDRLRDDRAILRGSAGPLLTPKS